MQCVDTAEAEVAAASGALQIASRRMTLAVRNTDAFYLILRKGKPLSKISLFCQTISAHLKENGKMCEFFPSWDAGGWSSENI